MNQKLSVGLRTALCIVLLALAYVVQTSLGLRISIFGVHIDLLPLIVAAAGIVMGPGAGLACGLAAGVLYDVSGAGIEGMYPLYYMICGIACGFFRGQFRGREIRGTMLCSVCTITLLAVLRYLFDFQFGSTGILAFARDMVLQALLAVVFSPLVLVVVRAVSGRKKPKAAVLPPYA